MDISEKYFNYPDIRDGLNAVERSIICAMYRMKQASRPLYTSAKSIVNKAEITEFMNRSEVGDMLTQMTKPFYARHPLVYDWEAFEMDGDIVQSINRCKRARLSLIAKFLFDGVSINNDPSALPCCFPNLVVNGARSENGYAVLPHNMHEITAAVHAIYENPEITEEELFLIVPGPDFSQNSIVVQNEDLQKIQKGETGKIILNGKNIDDKEIFVNCEVLNQIDGKEGSVICKCSLKQMLVVWMNHRLECIAKKAEIELECERNKKHLIDGVVAAVENIEDYLKMIRACNNHDEMIKNSIAFGLDKTQAEYMAHYPIRKICSYDKRTIYGRQEEKIANLEKLVNNKSAREQLMLKTLDMIDRKFGDERYTRIV